MLILASCQTVTSPEDPSGKDALAGSEGKTVKQTSEEAVKPAAPAQPSEGAEQIRPWLYPERFWRAARTW